jgi:hypothetical protein
VAQPKRINADLNGIWQLVTWQRQVLVASNCEEFNQQISDVIAELTRAFGECFKYYHPVPVEPCFNISGQAWLSSEGSIAQPSQQLPGANEIKPQASSAQPAYSPPKQVPSSITKTLGNR